MSAAPHVEAAAQAEPPARLPRRPTLFPPGFAPVEEFATFDRLLRRLRALAGPWPLSFTAGAAAYPGYDTFPSVTAYAGGHYLATVAVPGRSADDLRAAAGGDAA